MLKIIYIFSFSIFTPLIAYSSQINYCITALFFYLYIGHRIYLRRIDVFLLNYYLALLAIFVVNYFFASEHNTPWFINHIAFMAGSIVFSIAYSTSSDVMIDRFLRSLGRFNDGVCLVLSIYSVLLLIILSHYSEVIDFNFNGIIWNGTELFGWPKATLTILVGYATIWLAMARKKLTLGLFSISVLPIILAARSTLLSLVVVYFVLSNSSWIRRKKTAAVSMAICFVMVIVLAYVLGIELHPAFYYDRIANLMVSIDIANDHFFGNGNGTYHWFVERNQEELNSRYASFFSPFQIEVFLGPESMFNHVIGSFGYLLAIVFFYLQISLIIRAFALFYTVKPYERFIIVFWFSSFISGIGQTTIMTGFPYFILWAFVLGICSRIYKMEKRNHSKSTNFDLVKSHNAP